MDQKKLGGTMNIKRRYRRRRGRKISEKDPYIQYILWDYAIRASPFCRETGNSNYIEYIYKMLFPVDLKEIVKFAKEELSKYREEGQADEGSLKGDVREIERNLSHALSREEKFTLALDGLKEEFHDIYCDVMEHCLEKFTRYTKKKIAESEYLKRSDELKRTFGLTEKESEILTFLYLLKIDDDVNSVFNLDLHMDDIKKSARLYSIFFKISPMEFQKILSKSSTLVRTGIIKKNRRDELDISELVLSYLAGVANLDLMDNFIKKADLSDALEVHEHNIAKERLEDVLGLLSSDHGLNLLLHGSPGTGKSEFAKSLGKELKKDVYFINQKDNDEEEDLGFRKTSLIAAINMLDPNKSIIVVDECDEIINNGEHLFFGMSLKKEGDDSKAWLNDLLETNRQKTIWISNRVSSIDPSTKRRFSYSLEFLDLGYQQRLNVWRTQARVKEANFLSKGEIENFARKFKVNAGGISLALKDVSGMRQLKTKAEKISKLENILTQHQSFVFGETKLNPLQESYSLEAINSDAKLELVLGTTQKFLEYAKNGGTQEIANMNFLLHGPSGTGKTEFAKFLAQTLGKELLVKRMSDLQSMYVGQTEKLISRAFKEAESSSSILFLDEADSLFINRAGATRSWEVSQTNELLCQMENFRGILICATNHQTNMDVAVMRRFNHKIKFDYLTPAGKELLAVKVLGVNLSDSEKMILSRIPCLTPGDFKVVRQKNFFNKEVSVSELLVQLEAESSYKRVSKPLGL
jgi:transitional endoplasmic reticulum ATPase